jgi:hypothetical protein
MAAAAASTRRLLSAVARLTGDPGRSVRHGSLFRIEVESSDGKTCAVTVQVNDHRERPSKAALNDIADRLRVERKEIASVLDKWGEAELREHLGKLTAEELRQPAHGLAPRS